MNVSSTVATPVITPVAGTGLTIKGTDTVLSASQASSIVMAQQAYTLVLSTQAPGSSSATSGVAAPVIETPVEDDLQSDEQTDPLLGYDQDGQPTGEQQSGQLLDELA